ncbi:MAG: class I SAM-dependent methyltransferase [Nitrosopumilus sp.]
MAYIRRVEEILRGIEQDSKKRNLPIIGPIKGRVLDDVVIQTKPKVILEIGTLVGYSALRMSRFLPSGARIMCVEISNSFAEEAQDNFSKAGLSNMIQIIIGDAKEVIPNLKETVDLLFLDAEKINYLTYLNLAERMLHKGSTIVADNAGMAASEMQNFLSYVRESPLYQSKYHDFDLDGWHDGVEVSTKIG